MFKSYITTLVCAACMMMVAINANAAQVNLKLGSDIISHKDVVNIAAEIYYSTGPGPLDISSEAFKLDLPTDKVYEWFRSFNQIIASKKLVTNFDGKLSQISLGYKLNAADIYPVTCNNIKIKFVTNITLSETGCTAY